MTSKIEDDRNRRQSRHARVAQIYTLQTSSYICQSAQIIVFEEMLLKTMQNQLLLKRSLPQN